MWDRFREDRRWAFHHYSMRTAERISEGDSGVVYLTKSGQSPPGRLAANVEFIGRGQLETSENAVYSFYPFHVPFRIVRLAIKEALFSDFVPRLSFIFRKDRYGPYLQGKSAIALKPDDAALLLSVFRPLSISHRPSGPRQGRGGLPNRANRNHSPKPATRHNS